MHSKFDRLLIFVAAVAIAVLALRSLIGPFPLPGFHEKVNSPFVTESAFWLAIFGLLCFREQPGMAPQSRAVFPGVYLAIVLCAIALAFARNLSDPFLSDDYIILSGPSFDWASFLAALHRPGGDGSFRPFGTIYYQILKAFAGRSPAEWHLTGLSLHVLNSSLVFLIAWQLWHDRTTAAVSSLVFGLHGTRPEVVVWTAGNCDLLATACVLGSISLSLSARAGAARFRFAISMLLVAAGVLFKESAYALPLVAFWILLSGQGQSQHRTRAFLIGSFCVCVALLAWRWHLFHGPGGYIDGTTGQPAILSLHPLTAAKAVFIRMWAILLVPVNWDAPGTWWLTPAIGASMAGVLFLVVANSSRRTQLLLIAATCCAVLPAIHLALIGQSGLGSRILYLPGATFALLIGSLTLLADKRRTVAAAVMIVGTAGILEHNLAAWQAAGIQAQALCRDAAREPQAQVRAPGTVDGVFLFENGFAECVAAARDAKP